MPEQRETSDDRLQPAIRGILIAAMLLADAAVVRGDDWPIRWLTQSAPASDRSDDIELASFVDHGCGVEPDNANGRWFGGPSATCGLSLFNLLDCDRCPGNIREPGPDFGDFPNSAEVLSPGGVYLETAFMVAKQRAPAGPKEADELFVSLLRIGTIEDWELRLSLPTVAHLKQTGSDTTGTAPFAAGFKWHWVDQGEAWYEPGIGLEGQVNLPGGTSVFRQNVMQPSFTINVDHRFTDPWSYSWNAGLGSSVDNSGHMFLQGCYQYSLAYSLNEDLNVYTHGDVLFSGGNGTGTIYVAGFGILYYLNDWSALTANYNRGLTSVSPNQLAEIGLTFAY